MPFQIHAYGLGQPSFIYSRTSLSEGDLFDLADFAAARVRNIVGASPRGSMTAQATRQVSDAYGQLAAAILLRDGLDFLMSHAAHGSSLRITARHTHYVVPDTGRYLQLGLGPTGDGAAKVHKIAAALVELDMHYWGIVLELAQAVWGYHHATAGANGTKMLQVQLTL